jgi:hypothetical protein
MEIQLPDVTTVMEISKLVGAVGVLIALFVCRQLWKCSYLLNEIHFDIKLLGIGLGKVETRVEGMESFQLESKADRAAIKETLKGHESRISKLESKP